MKVLRALRLQLAMLVIAAVLLQAVVPALHAHARGFAGGGLPWSDLCTSSGQALERTVPLVADRATPSENLRLPLSHGDHDCPACLTSFNGVPAAPWSSDPIALNAPQAWLKDQQARDRASAWSTRQTRGPPFTG